MLKEMEHSTTAVFTAPNRPMSIIQLPVPELGSREILVKNEFVTLCRSDLNTYFGKRKEATPTILGHEVVGRIVHFGKDAIQTDLRGNNLQLGCRISWAIFSSDPDCRLSKEGIPQKGDHLIKYGHEPITQSNTLHGGLSEYIILRENTPLTAISEDVPLPVAALINCTVATIAGAARLLGDLQHKNFLVAGAGMLGLMACAMLKVLGAASVTVLEQNPVRLGKAGLFGADYRWGSIEESHAKVHPTFKNARPFDGLIECSGVPEVMEETLGLLNTGGKAVWVGATYPARKIQLDAESIIRRLVTINGLHNYNTEDFAAAADFIECHHNRFPFLDLVKGSFGLLEVDAAFSFAMKTNPYRVGIKLT